MENVPSPFSLTKNDHYYFMKIRENDDVVKLDLQENEPEVKTIETTEQTEQGDINAE